MILSYCNDLDFHYIKFYLWYIWQYDLHQLLFFKILTCDCCLIFEKWFLSYWEYWAIHWYQRLNYKYFSICIDWFSILFLILSKLSKSSLDGSRYFKNCFYLNFSFKSSKFSYIVLWYFLSYLSLNLTMMHVILSFPNSSLFLAKIASKISSTTWDSLV